MTSFSVLTSSHVSYDVTGWGGAGQYMSRNQKSEISRQKKIQIASNSDTSRKIVRQTFPERLTKIWRTDVTWRHFRTSCEVGGAILPPPDLPLTKSIKFFSDTSKWSDFFSKHAKLNYIKSRKSVGLTPANILWIFDFCHRGDNFAPLAGNRVNGMQITFVSQIE